MKFSRNDKLKFHYEINGLNTASYFTLFNVLSSGKLSIVIENEPIEANTIYSWPKTHWSKFSKTDTQLRLEPGHEYFKAMVTAEPITWDKFFKTNTAPSQILGTKVLEVDVY